MTRKVRLQDPSQAGDSLMIKGRTADMRWGVVLWSASDRLECVASLIHSSAELVEAQLIEIDLGGVCRSRASIPGWYHVTRATAPVPAAGDLRVRY